MDRGAWWATFHGVGGRVGYDQATQHSTKAQRYLSIFVTKIQSVKYLCQNHRASNLDFLTQKNSLLVVFQ